MLRVLLAAGLILTGQASLALDPFKRALGGSYELVDHNGNTRTEADPEGRAQLLFFGYAKCPDICTAALPLMAGMIDALDEAGHDVQPLMITVDPLTDTVETMGPEMVKWHPKFLGLTGSKDALAVSYEAFEVEITPLFQAPDGQWIYAHGSFIYLLDGKGEFLTLIPPILGPEEAANIVKGYLEGSSSS